MSEKFICPTSGGKGVMRKLSYRPDNVYACYDSQKGFLVLGSSGCSLLQFTEIFNFSGSDNAHYEYDLRKCDLR